MNSNAIQLGDRTIGNGQPCFNYLGYKKGDFPVTEQACREVLALPIYAELTDDQQRYVVDTLKDFYTKSPG